MRTSTPESAFRCDVTDSDANSTQKIPPVVDHTALSDAKVKEILRFLRDPNTYTIKPGKRPPLGVWMNDGIKMADLIERTFLAKEVELSVIERVEHVRRAAQAVDLTTFIFAATEPDGGVSAHVFNASTDGVLLEGTALNAKMPLSGEFVEQRFDITLGFNAKRKLDS